MSSIREARQLWQFVEDAEALGQSVVMATLVTVVGSAYRRPGAKMVMRQDGRMRGTLSGGCLEGDLFLHAETVMATGKPSIHHYDLTEDEMWGLGIGCKGTVDVWLEPIHPQEPFWQGFQRAVSEDQLVLWGAELPEGRRFLMTPRDTVGDVPTWARALPIESGIETGRQDGFWWDVMRPPERLIVAGAGHDAEPLVRLASQAGFEVTVLDPRPHVNNPDHFPQARHWVKAPEEVTPAEVIGSYWVIMNHHQRRDEAAIRLAYASAPRFLGILGPRQRTDEMIANLGIQTDGLPLRAPVGLDVGAETPEEVAVSIVGEMMAYRRSRSGGPLNGRQRIHA
ncbi:Xanthine dehydrogenase [Sulfobacillus acidophilus TPY]|uniref:Xanthine dehydrogenase n=1 Tax=Sulfobacillus acidophilus (strain ATCC 700253 / DSM 10332 / NAL) TaxID=679936 RepID=G8TVX4_SULAD|nr:Xanthine dehydrogenase [Sulfobacillus acidophilus TPY]AEW04818.1 Xanthine dehydrogenase [Sulfobacillus acidophilus DSM 10332]